MTKLEQTVWDLTKPICEANNLELVEVNLKKEFGETILEVLIDKEDGVSIDDTTLVNEELGKLLDVLDPISNAYLLEVSSVGIERVLKSSEDVKKSINKYVHIEFNDPIMIENNKTSYIEGTLLDVLENTYIVQINLKGRMKKIEVLINNVKLIRLAIKF